MRAYLDIETTFTRTISVIGIYRPDHGTIQLVGGGVTHANLYAALEGVATIVTFNGSSFDLPWIRKQLRVDLLSSYAHRDLLHVCRRRGLHGGLKVVERLLGIARAAAEIDGREAMRLWQRYEVNGDQEALHRLLAYNYEDVVNLAVVEALLDGNPVGLPAAARRILT